MSFVSSFKPTLDALRTNIPSTYGIRSATLTVRTVRFEGDYLTGGQSVMTDTAITGPTGGRYRVKDVSTKDVVASGGQFQHGAIRVGPITPPHPGGAWTAEDLIPSSASQQSVIYIVTDQTGRAIECQMASADTMNDLHWYIVLNPTGTTSEGPTE